MSSPYYYEPSNGVLPVVIDNRYVRLKNEQYYFKTNPIPPNIIKSDSLWELRMIANELNYCAVISSPYDQSKSSKELLIYNRVDSIWNSYFVSGIETRMRIVNNYLVGVIANPNPESNYSKRKMFPSILDENVVFLSPMSEELFTVHLGKNCEVLWIDDNNDVYYRLDDSLYKARIDKNEFVDRQLLLTNYKIRYIHWAFRGSTGE